MLTAFPFGHSYVAGKLGAYVGIGFPTISYIATASGCYQLEELTLRDEACRS